MKEYRFSINGRDYDVNVDGIRDGKASVTVNGVSYKVECGSAGADAAVTADPVPQARVNGNAGAAAAAGERTLTVKDADTAAQSTAAGGRKVEAPLPGVIIAVNVAPGQQVKRGQKIAVLEAMKMENDILSPTDGTVREITVQRGDSVLEGATIATIA